MILRTGPSTFFGQLAHEIAGRRVPTAFDQGIDRFTWLMIRFILVMVPTVFLINGLTKHDWLEALLFAVAVAVGLTPEMLPMIVTVNLAKGAIAMSREKVIVKRLNAIQNLGAMDVLCTDKTGTLTQDRIILKRHLDIHGEESERVLQYALLEQPLPVGTAKPARQRRPGPCRTPQEARQSTAAMPSSTRSRSTSRAAASRSWWRARTASTFSSARVRSRRSSRFAPVTPSTGRRGGSTRAISRSRRRRRVALNSDGFRVVAVAYKEMDPSKTTYSVADETDLTLLGYIAFLDPPKESAREAIAALARRGVQVKILTGDNEVITRKICHEVQARHRRDPARWQGRGR